MDFAALILPRWATGGADVDEPLSAEKDVGWDNVTPPQAQYDNWLNRQDYEAHLVWRDMLWFAASDNWIAHDSDMISAVSNIKVEEILVMNDLDLVLACGGILASTGSISSSPDGSAWTERANVANGYFQGMATNGSLILAVGGSSAANKKIYSSADGTTWTDRTAGYTLANPDDAFSDVVYDSTNSLWIIISKGGEIYTSVDPLAAATWTLQHDFGLGSDLRHIDNNPTSGKSIVCANNSTPKVSTDGTTWGDLTLTGVTGTWDPTDGQVIYASQDGVDTWVMSGRLTDTSTRTAFVFSIDDGVNWEAMEAANGYPFYGATGNNPQAQMIGYSPVLKHWIFAETELSTGNAAFRMWAGVLGEPGSFSLRNFPPVMTDFDNDLASKAVWFDLESARKNQAWLVGADADSDEAIFKSDNPAV